MTNFDRFVEILEQGVASTSPYLRDNGEVFVVAADDAIDETVLAEAGIDVSEYPHPSAAYYQNLEVCAPIFRDFCTRAGVYFYAREKHEFFISEAVDLAAGKNLKYVIVENLS